MTRRTTLTTSMNIEEGAGATRVDTVGQTRVSVESEDWRRSSGPVASLRGRRLYKRWTDAGVLQPDLNQRLQLCVIGWIL